MHALNVGLLPAHYFSSLEESHLSLKAYIEDYLTEEVQTDGLVRQLPTFARFLDVMAFSHGELINYSNIARDIGVDRKTVKEYYQILVDTLLGYFIAPYAKKIKREALGPPLNFIYLMWGFSIH